MRSTRASLLLLLLAGPTACTLSSSGVVEPPPDQAFLFEVEHVNHAWGFAWTGFHVDRLGDVWSYSLEAPWPHREKKSFTAAELLEKYDVGRSRVTHVESDRLNRMFALVEQAGTGGLTEPVHRCADAGTVTFVAHQYDPASARYSPVLLRQEGDWARDNRSEAAHELYEWLKTLVPGSGISGCEP